MKFVAGLTVAVFCLWAQTAHAIKCTVSATTLAFGTYNPLSGPAALSTGTISITCGKGRGASYTMALNTGGSGSYFPRRMTSGAKRLSYQLFTNAARTVVWGDGSAGTSTVTDSMYIPPGPGTVTQNYTIYGQIPALQPVSPGSYSDVITVTVTYN